MKKAFIITCIIDGLFDTAYRHAPLTVIAEDEEKAKENAVMQIVDWYGKTKNGYHVTIEKIKPVDGPLGRITVLMEHFGKVDLSPRILKRDIEVQVQGRPFLLDGISQQGNRIAVSGCSDKWTRIPIDHVEEESLPLVEEALECAVGKDADPFMREFLLLEDLFNGSSPYRKEIPAEVFNQIKDNVPVKATLLGKKEGTPRCILVHKESPSGCEPALLISEDAMNMNDTRTTRIGISDFCD